MTDRHTADDLRTPETLKRENRTLAWKVKNLGKQLGRAGETIYRLRNENAALRAGLQLTPGDYTRLYQQHLLALRENDRLHKELTRATAKPKPLLPNIGKIVGGSGAPGAGGAIVGYDRAARVVRDVPQA